MVFSLITSTVNTTLYIVFYISTDRVDDIASYIKKEKKKKKKNNNQS